MKRILVSMAALCLVSGPAAASAKAPIEGRWKNGKMEVVIAPCGRNLCGTVVKASAIPQRKAERGSGTELIGATLIKNIEKNGPNSYRASVFVADRNIHARGSIRQVSPNELKVRGCVLGVLCKSKTWERVR
jgi:uncharacterized protein (DUF2147 family)